MTQGSPGSSELLQAPTTPLKKTWSSEELESPELYVVLISRSAVPCEVSGLGPVPIFYDADTPISTQAPMIVAPLGRFEK
jgi:hypothetical protein